MTENPEPTISVRVDPANPGQFFACCGLLELADRLWRGAEGWFDEDRFLISTDGALEDILRALLAELPEERTRLDNGLEVKPLIAPLRLSLRDSVSLTLDTWMTIRNEKKKIVAVANPPWNFWSGQQTPLRIWTALRTALLAQLDSQDERRSEDLFMHRVPLSGRFGFDPGAAWNALDVGFSPNEQGIPVSSSPAAELLAAVGMQRFRPPVSENCDAFRYATWGMALSPSVACAAAAGSMTVPPTMAFRGRVISRGSYAALGYSTM